VWRGSVQLASVAFKWSLTTVVYHSCSTANTFLCLASSLECRPIFHIFHPHGILFTAKSHCCDVTGSWPKTCVFVNTSISESKFSRVKVTVYQLVEIYKSQCTSFQYNSVIASVNRFYITCEVTNRYFTTAS